MRIENTSSKLFVKCIVPTRSLKYGDVYEVQKLDEISHWNERTYANKLLINGRWYLAGRFSVVDMPASPPSFFS